MSNVRKYTAIVSVHMISPEGKVIGSSQQNVTLDLDMSEFRQTSEADKYMGSGGEVDNMAHIAGHKIIECFGT